MLGVGSRLGCLRRNTMVSGSKLPPLPPVLALVHPPHKSPCHLPKMCSIQASKCSHSTPTTPITQRGRQPRLQAVMPALRATPGRPPAFRPDAPHRQNVACKTLSDTKPRGGREGDGGGVTGLPCCALMAPAGPHAAAPCPAAAARAAKRLRAAAGGGCRSAIVQPAAQQGRMETV